MAFLPGAPLALWMLCKPFVLWLWGPSSLVDSWSRDNLRPHRRVSLLSLVDLSSVHPDCPSFGSQTDVLGPSLPASTSMTLSGLVESRGVTRSPLMLPTRPPTRTIQELQSSARFSQNAVTYLIVTFFFIFSDIFTQDRENHNDTIYEKPIREQLFPTLLQITLSYFILTYKVYRNYFIYLVSNRYDQKCIVHYCQVRIQRERTTISVFQTIILQWLSKLDYILRYTESFRRKLTMYSDTKYQNEGSGLS